MKMKNLKKKAMLALASVVMPIANAQTSTGLKIKNIGDIEGQVKQGTDAIKNISFGVLGAVLAIGLIFVVYALATSNPKAKEYLIGWVVAVIVVLVAFMIV